MPTTLSTLNPAVGEIKMRYQEPYVTEGLNAKFTGVVPRGTYRGFRLAPNGGALSITIQADPGTLDHVAQYLTTDGHALTIRRVGGDFAVTLPASLTLIIAIYATYSVGSVTAGEIRAYTAAEWAALTLTQQTELVVLGTVVTPGLGVIPAANISHYRRVWAWGETGQDASPWTTLYADPSFEYLTLPTPVPDLLAQSQTGSHWFIQDTAGTGSWAVTTTDPSGQNALTFTRVGVGALGPRLWQNVMTPVQPGQAVRVKLSFKNLQISSAGSLNIVAQFMTSAGAAINPAGEANQIYTIDTSAVDANYRTIDQVFIAPTNAAFLMYVSVESRLTDLQYPVAAAGFRVNDFQAWLEPLGGLNNAKGRVPGVQALFANIVRFLTGIAGSVAPDPADAFLQQTITGEVLLGRADGVEDATHQAPALNLRGNLVLGEGIVDAAYTATPRLHTHIQLAGLDYALLWEAQNTSAGGWAFRIYQNSNGDLVCTVNASWNSIASEWSRDAAGASLRFTLASNTLTLSSVQAAAASPWGDGGWPAHSTLQLSLDGATNTTQELLLGWPGIATTPIVKLLGDGGGGNLGPQLLLNKSNPAPTAAIGANTLYSSNIPKCFGYVQTTGGSSTAVSVIDGYGIASAAVTNPGGALHVVFTHAMVANYAVVAIVEGANEYMYMDTHNTASFDLKNSAINLYSGAGRTIHFIVLGAQ